jgi:DNA-binding transcriptional LysR family regulator
MEQNIWMADLKNVDLHLLACFEALVTERSVTRAAARMDLSQPAMSNALARLRQLFQDELLVRTNRGMVITDRALEAAVIVRETLQALSALLSGGQGFEPASTQCHFTIAVTDYTASILIPHLIPLLRREAPGMQITFILPDQSRVRDWLDSGYVDVMVGYLVDLPGGLRSAELFGDHMCCIAAARHPHVQGSISLETYIAARHVCRGAAGTQQFTLEVMVDRTLADMGLHRNVSLRTQTAFGMAEAVACSDLLGTIATKGAERYRMALGVQILALPFSSPEPTISMVWHERTHRHAAARWLRDAMRRCFPWR